MVKVLVAGDFVPNDRVLEEIETSNASSVFCQLTPYTSGVDFALLNLECPVSTESARKIEKRGPVLSCSAKGIDIIKKCGFNCVTLANNHINDYSTEGINATISALTSAKIDYVGAGHNLSEASRILYKEINGVKIAFINCCEHEFSIATDSSAGANPLNPIQQFYQIKEARQHADFILVIVHGGMEYVQLPSPRMVETYRFFIDAGADAVVNHHQHCSSGYEVYNGKPIFYGLGNLCFDSLDEHHPCWNQGYCVSLELDSNISFNIVPYIQCDDSPIVRTQLSDSELALFQNQLDHLNSIISNPDLLAGEFASICSKGQKAYMAILQPYQNHYVRSLYKRGLLPDILIKEKRLLAMNYIVNESHRDRLIFALQIQNDKANN